MTMIEHLAGDWKLEEETVRDDRPVQRFRSEKHSMSIYIVGFDDSVWYVEGRKDGEKDRIVPERRFVCSEDAELYLIGLTHKYS